jgi:quinol monooxygenase YgiN
VSEVVVVVTLRARPDQQEAFERELRTLIGQTHSEPGCLLFAMHQRTDDPTAFCVIERWASREALDEHFGSEHVVAYMASTQDLLAAPMELVLYEARPEGDSVKGTLG